MELLIQHWSIERGCFIEEDEPAPQEPVLRDLPIIEDYVDGRPLPVTHGMSAQPSDRTAALLRNEGAAMNHPSSFISLGVNIGHRGSQKCIGHGEVKNKNNC